MGYIYKIINNINDKVYIGQTQRSIQERWKEHLKESNSTRVNHPIYRAMRKYGNEHFNIVEIEQIDNDLLNQREQYWIEQYNSYNNGYNATLGGDGKRTDYTEIYQLWQEGKLINEIASITSRKRDTISLVLRQNYNISEQEIRKRAAIHTKQRGFCKPSKVYQVDKDTDEILNIFDTIIDAALSLHRENQHSTEVCISQVCKGKKITAYGYKWKYADK